MAVTLHYPLAVRLVNLMADMNTLACPETTCIDSTEDGISEVSVTVLYRTVEVATDAWTALNRKGWTASRETLLTVKVQVEEND